jgi:crotonobetainyl-CoA:carnitine CoA-transferase CaiB-like acyl-CoA transferase
MARDRGLGGQHIDMALFDVQAALLANQASNYFVSGKVPGRKGNAHPNIVPYQDFPTADGRIAIAVGNDRQFAAFAKALGRADWAGDARYATNAARVENRERLVAEITLILSDHDTGHWQNLLEAARVPTGPIQTVDQVFAHPQALDRHLRQDVDLGSSGKASLVASPIRLSQTPASLRYPPPRLGAHTQEVLQERLGLDQNLVNRLRDRGIVG